MNKLSFDILDYLEARRIQDKLVADVLSGESEESIIFCQHPNVITLGKRTKESDLVLTREEWKKRGVEIISVDRGGGPTFHGPGQLLIYPVLNLKKRKIGIKNFVDRFLFQLASVLEELGLKTLVELNPTALYLIDKNSQKSKIAAIGLRIVHGVTSHGFSLNINTDLSYFKLFNPCGELETQYTSLSNELGDFNLNIKKIENKIFDFVSKDLK